MGPHAPRQAGRPVTQPRRQHRAWLGGLDPAGMLCPAAACPPSGIVSASRLPWPLPRGDALACRCWMRPPSFPWWHPQLWRTVEEGRGLGTTAEGRGLGTMVPGRG